jgi:hypothetical protein
MNMETPKSSDVRKRCEHIEIGAENRRMAR